MQNRVELLKGYLNRLSQGEAPETVKKDFVETFQHVDASEIMAAEQQMIQEGTPVEEVQKLCDIHSALFHKATREEKEHTARELALQDGHPLQTFVQENDNLEELLEQVRAELEQKEVEHRLVERLREVAVHYAKKGDLLYPHLSVEYGITGPSDVMWTVDDEIRDELADLVCIRCHDDTWMERLEAVCQRVEEMIYKEVNILFPNCALYFTPEEWIGIYHDAKDYPACLGVTPKNWPAAEKAKPVREHSDPRQKIRMAGGEMTVEQITALLNTLPMEITFVDEQDTNCYFNEGPKDFKRPGMALGRKVYTCHPPKIEQQVRRILQEFRQGTLDEVPVWMEKNGKTMLVTYMAVRDHEGRYLGTVELVQDMGFAKEHFMS